MCLLVFVVSGVAAGSVSSASVEGVLATADADAAAATFLQLEEKISENSRILAPKAARNISNGDALKAALSKKNEFVASKAALQAVVTDVKAPVTKKLVTVTSKKTKKMQKKRKVAAKKTKGNGKRKGKTGKKNKKTNKKSTKMSNKKKLSQKQQRAKKLKRLTAKQSASKQKLDAEKARVSDAKHRMAAATSAQAKQKLAQEVAKRMRTVAVLQRKYSKLSKKVLKAKTAPMLDSQDKANLQAKKAKEAAKKAAKRKAMKKVARAAKAGNGKSSARKSRKEAKIPFKPAFDVHGLDISDAKKKELAMQDRAGIARVEGESCETNCRRGTCVQDRCVCKAGFYGKFCELGSGICVESTQEGCVHGTCRAGECVCKKGYYGTRCDQKGCPGNCSLKGICLEPTEDTAQCLCLYGTSGADCSVSGCGKEGCVHGTCEMDFGGRTKCKCKPGYAGVDCAKRVCDPCINGACNGVRCMCHKGFTGDDCSKKTCPDCGKRGVCDESTGECICQPPYFNRKGGQPNCKGNLNVCPKMCSGDMKGVCTAKGCRCKKAWTGKACDEVRCPHDCSKRGTCKLGKCFCDAEFGGEDCSQRLCPKQCSGHGLCTADSKCKCLRAGAKTALKSFKTKNPSFIDMLVSGVASPMPTTPMTTPTPTDSAVSTGATLDSAPLGVQAHFWQPLQLSVVDSGFDGADCGNRKCKSDCGASQGRGTCDASTGTCICKKGFYWAKQGQDCNVSICTNKCSDKGLCLDGKCHCLRHYSGANCETRADPPVLIETAASATSATAGKGTVGVSAVAGAADQSMSQDQGQVRTTETATTAKSAVVVDAKQTEDAEVDATALAGVNAWEAQAQADAKSAAAAIMRQLVNAEEEEDKDAGLDKDDLANIAFMKSLDKEDQDLMLQSGLLQEETYLAALSDELHEMDGGNGRKGAKPRKSKKEKQQEKKGKKVEQKAVKKLMAQLDDEHKKFAAAVKAIKDSHNPDGKGCVAECSGRGQCVKGKCFCFNSHGLFCDKLSCPNSCSGKGVCDDHKGVCKCTDGWGGQDCSEETCIPADCSKHGKCVKEKFTQKPLCACDKGWTGVKCETEICPKKCSGNGVCIKGDCFCKPGFSGKDCEKASCDFKCGANGKCGVSPVGEAVCVCKEGFAGPTCAFKACSKKCGRGRCFDGKCVCEVGWTGALCDKKGQCASPNCSGHGKCLGDAKTGQAFCKCDKGFGGPTCSSTTCSKDCSKRGECLDGACVCKNGWKGVACKQGCPNECSGAKQGQCLPDKLGRPSCECKKPFHGKDCSRGRCPGDGLCNMNGKCDKTRGMCVCKPGYTGAECKDYSYSTCVTTCTMECNMHGPKGAFLWTNIMTGQKKMITVKECVSTCNDKCKRKNAKKTKGQKGKSFLETERALRPLI